MRSQKSREFLWPLSPDLMTHWSVYYSDSSGKLEGHSLTDGLKRASDEKTETDEKTSSSNKESLPPIKTFLQRLPDTFPIPTHITNLNTSKSANSLTATAEAAKGTCTTVQYTIGDNPGGGKIVRRIV